MTNKTNTKEIWKGIRQIITLKSKSSFTPNKLVKDGHEIKNVKEIANEFNNYFSNIAQLVEHCTGIAEVTGSNPAEA